jgi:hypothetical protein
MSAIEKDFDVDHFVSLVKSFTQGDHEGNVSRVSCSQGVLQQWEKVGLMALAKSHRVTVLSFM